jgi:uncharacterized membrane protein
VVTRALAARGRLGSLSVEAALCLPVLSLAILGGLEYGWMFHTKRQMRAVVEQAALVGAAHNGTAGMVRTTAESVLRSRGLADLDYRLELEPAGPALESLDPGDELCVTLVIPYGQVSFTGLARPAPALMPAPTHLVESARRARHAAP